MYALHICRPWTAYENLTSDQRKARYEKEAEAERNKWIEEGKRQAMTAKTGSPDALTPAGPVWEQLTRKSDDEPSTSRDRVAAALQEYVETGTA